MLVDRTSYFDPLKIDIILEMLEAVIPSSEDLFRILCRLIAVRPVGDLDILFTSLVGLVQVVGSLDANLKHAYYELVH